MCYWFERARAMIEAGHTKRAGLIATNSIRGGANRRVLERIKDTGDIFMAWSDEPWVLDGAAVRVSLVAFDGGSQQERTLNGQPVAQINPDLTNAVDITVAAQLAENKGLSYKGVEPHGGFDIPEDVARSWLTLPNPSGVSNAEVLRRYYNSQDFTKKVAPRWIVDFTRMPLEKAQEYVLPFAYVEENLKEQRRTNPRKSRRENWWMFGEMAVGMRASLQGLPRYLVTPHVSKHRFFVWLDSLSLTSNLLISIARDDDYTFGVLQSNVHEGWALGQGTAMGKGNDPRYTPSTCFETFPFPCPTDEQRAEVAKWAKYLDDVRNQLLRSDERLTMTALYNELEAVRGSRDSDAILPRSSGARAYPLLIAHERLDAAVAAAYGWEWPLGEDEMLGRLLALNLERAKGEAAP